MNCVQLSGTITAAPSIIEHGTGIRFIIKARYPSEDEHSRAGIAYIPCTTFDVTKEQRDILMGNDFRNYFVELSGRMILAVYENGKGQKFYNIEVIANPNGLLIQQRVK